MGVAPETTKLSYTRLGIFLHLMKHDFYIISFLNISSFQQSKLESSVMYTLRVIKLTKVAYENPTHIISFFKAYNQLRGVQHPLRGMNTVKPPIQDTSQWLGTLGFDQIKID